MLKRPPFRSKKLRESAREAPCVCCGSTGRTVLAHRNVPGHFGIASKGHDFWAAYLCDECHRYGDGDGRRDFQWWEHAVLRTQLIWLEQGLARFG